MAKWIKPPAEVLHMPKKADWYGRKGADKSAATKPASRHERREVIKKPTTTHERHAAEHKATRWRHSRARAALHKAHEAELEAMAARHAQEAQAETGNPLADASQMNPAAGATPSIPGGPAPSAPAPAPGQFPVR